MSRFSAHRALAALIALASAETHAHSDTPFPRGADGSLNGTPAEYAPASALVDLEPLQMCTTTPPTFAITVAANVLALPPCIVALFRDADEGRVRFAGSWYHERSLLPPYMSVVIPVGPAIPELPYRAFEEFHLLINLDTAALLRITHEITTKTEGGSWSTRGVQLIPENFCTNAEMSSLSPVSVTD